MNQVFVSYAKEDSSIAEKLAKALQHAGYSVWWDRHIPPGKTWDEVIGRALDSATCVVVLWSRRSVESRWVREEAEKGASRGCLIPALVEKVEPPFGFGRIQAANLSGWSGDESDPEFTDLLQAVSDLVHVTTVGPAADERVAESVKPLSESDDSRTRTEPIPSKREESQKKRPGKGMGIFMKLALAVVGLAAAGYFSLEHFFVAEPQVLSFQAAPATIERGRPVTLSWQTRNASRVELEGVGQVALTGSHTLNPRGTGSYTLTATNRRGRSYSRTVQVAVTEPVPVKPNWIRVVHRGVYIAKFFVQWEGQTKLWSSGDRAVGYSETIQLPPNIKTVVLHAQVKGLDFRWHTIFKETDAPVQRTYTVGGMLGAVKWSASPPL